MTGKIGNGKMKGRRIKRKVITENGKKKLQKGNEMAKRKE